MFWQYLPVVMVAVAAPLAYKAKFLDLSGVVFAAVLGLIVGLSLGPLMLAVLLLFLVMNSIFTRLDYVNKALKGAAEPKGGVRTWRSVMANGLVAAVFATLEKIHPGTVFEIGFLGSIAVASADTMSTEIGLLSLRKPRMITNFRVTEPGTSGAITGLGVLGGVLGALIISAVGLLFLHYSINIADPRHNYALVVTTTSNIGGAGMFALIVAVGGVFGSFVDSFLGGTLQGRFVCATCGTRTERAVHCGARATRLSGLRFLDNDTVNVLAVAAGAAFASGLYLLLRPF